LPAVVQLGHRGPAPRCQFEGPSSSAGPSPFWAGQRRATPGFPSWFQRRV